jgi:hypothetical protein
MCREGNNGFLLPFLLISKGYAAIFQKSFALVSLQFLLSPYFRRSDLPFFCPLNDHVRVVSPDRMAFLKKRGRLRAETGCKGEISDMTKTHSQRIAVAVRETNAQVWQARCALSFAGKRLVRASSSGF